MSYNFKSIADTQVVAEPSESVHVLIEENGEIKRAPKTAVGGSGGGETYVIYKNGGDITATEGIYDAVVKFLADPIANFINIVIFENYSDYLYCRDLYDIYHPESNNNGRITFDTGMLIYLYEDGTFSYYDD